MVKLNPAGSGLVYATFLGGNDNDYGQGIAVDGSGNAYVAGNTWSANFPTTPNAFDTSHNGGSDAFMVKLNPAGSGLVYATLLGGSDDDYGHGVVVGGNGSAYMAGETDSSNFPTTPGAFDTSYNGGDGADAFVARLNSAGSGLVYATYLGGSRFDAGYGITVNVSGSAYVTGETGSSNFPTTSGAFDTSYNGGDIDAYVVKLNPAGSGLAYATFLGGSGGDWGNLITVNVNGSAYVVGPTGSSNFPTTPGSFDTGYNGGDRDAFVVKLNPAGGGLAYATFLGGNGTDFGNGIAVDGSGSAYVVGRTGSSDFPTTPGSFDTSYNGGDRDAYVAKLNPSGSGLSYATFLGGSRSDSGYGSIAVDGSGSAYVTGQTHSSNFPTTSGAFDTSYNGGDRDAYVAKLAIPTPLYLPLILLGIPQPPPGARTLISIADTTLLEGYPSSNLGDASDMWVGYDDELDPNAKIARGLIKFDLSSVPNGATIQNATLRIYYMGHWEFPNWVVTITAYRAQGAWQEMAVTWNNKPGFGNSYGSVDVVADSNWRWYELDVKNLVQNWVNGSFTNDGIMLRGEEASGAESSRRSFFTREGEHPPELVVTYGGAANTQLPSPTVPDASATRSVRIMQQLNVFEATDDGTGRQHQSLK